jgi:subtilisin family serine protease
LVLLLIVLSGRAPAAQNKRPVISAQNVHKLTDAEDIISGLEDAQSTVRVIVNLFEPNEVQQKNLWKKPASRIALRQKILARRDEVLSTIGEREFRLRRSFDNLAAFSGEITADGLNSLLSNPKVKSIEPDRIEYMHLAQGIPLIDGMAYRSIYDGSGVAIAIVDTGIDYTHPRLGGGGFPNSKVIGGYDFGDDDSDPMPVGIAHGTCCAGIAAGDLGTYGDYIGGVAPAAKLYALKITRDGEGTAFDSDIIASWDWCISHQHDDLANPILVISLSFGGGRYLSSCDGSLNTYASAADRAGNAGITIFASSGNDGFCNSMAGPACVSSIISVGAVYDAAFGTLYPCVNSASCADKFPTTGCSTGWYAVDTAAADMVTSYSNTASFLDLFAPSNKAYTTDIAGSGGYSSGSYYNSFGGTSASCPYAAGAAAVLQSAAKTINADYLSPSDLRDILILAGDNITDGKVAITKPRVNLKQAIEIIVPPCCTDTVTSFPYTEDFEGETLCGTSCGTSCLLTGYWTNNLNDDIDWTVDSGGTPSSSTGPATDHNPGTSAGKYLYTESSSTCIDSEAVLNGPCFDLSSLDSPELRFWYHMYGAAMGSLTVEISDNNCASWTEVWTLAGNQGNSWQEAVVDLSAYGGSVIKVRFIGLTGSSFTSDMAIDDIQIVDAAPVQYTLNISSGPGGSVTEPGEGAFVYDDGTVVDINAAEDPGYHFVNWTGDTATITDANASETTIVVDANYSIQANFALDLFAPEITSSPVTTAAVGQLYTYDVNANGLPAPTYSLLTSPNNMTIDVNTGLIEWTPAEQNVGPNVPVSVRAENTEGFDQQSFEIDVNGIVPEITSSPIMTATVNLLYTYDVNADGIPAPVYSLIISPNDMTIDVNTGLIEWTPVEQDIGPNVPVTVRAENIEGFDQQSFVIDVDGLAPVITSSPVTAASADSLYSYDVDANGIPAPTYLLIVAPNDMTIDSNTGLIQWTPDYFDIDQNSPVTVEVTNSQGSQQQDFKIAVLSGDNFNDNARSAMWRVSEDDYELARIAEDQNRLELLAPEPNSTASAVYATNGWALDANESFSVQVDYHYADAPGWVGIAAEGEQEYIAISAGADSNESYYYYETIVDGNLISEQETRDGNDGTLYIWYDVDSNNLYVSHTGPDVSDAYIWQTMGNPLQQDWLSPADIVLGGGSSGGAFAGSEAYLDNFKATAGRLYKWPPITDLDGDGFIDLGDIAVFTKYWLAEPNTPADFDGDDAVDFTDFAELGLAW